MKVVEAVFYLNDSQICGMVFYFSQLRCFSNIHLCAVVNVVSTQRLYSVFYVLSSEIITDSLMSRSISLL